MNKRNLKNSTRWMVYDQDTATLLHGMKQTPTQRLRALGEMIKFVQAVQPKMWLRATDPQERYRVPVKD